MMIFIGAVQASNRDSVSCFEGPEHAPPENAGRKLLDEIALLEALLVFGDDVTSGSNSPSICCTA
jgi:hypothetical protein